MDHRYGHPSSGTPYSGPARPQMSTLPNGQPQWGQPFQAPPVNGHQVRQPQSGPFPPAPPSVNGPPPPFTNGPQKTAPQFQSVRPSPVPMDSPNRNSPLMMGNAKDFAGPQPPLAGQPPIPGQPQPPFAGTPQPHPHGPSQQPIGFQQISSPRPPTLQPGQHAPYPGSIPGGPPRPPQSLGGPPMRMPPFAGPISPQGAPLANAGTPLYNTHAPTPPVSSPVAPHSMPPQPSQVLPPPTSASAFSPLQQRPPMANQIPASMANRYPPQHQPAQSPAYPSHPNQKSPVFPQPTTRSMDGLTSQMGSMSVTQQGFNKLWGNNMETYDLMQMRNILPPTKIEAPSINIQHFVEAQNCSPDIFRCTLTKIPETKNLLDKSRLPLGILIHPFKDLSQLPVIQCNTIVRCRACRTYINPFVYFIDHRRWKCNICFRANELPD